METRYRVLVVDDEDAILFSYQKLLQGTVVDVHGCATFEEAIALIKSERYCAVITDLRLSHSESYEGLEILQYIKNHELTMPVIVLTGYGSDAIKDFALALGAYGYLDKPVAITEVIKLLNNIGIPAGEF